MTGSQVWTAGGGLDRDLSGGAGWVATGVLIHGAGDAGRYRDRQHRGMLLTRSGFLPVSGGLTGPGARAAGVPAMMDAVTNTAQVARPP
jgi:hypothetical protein